MTRYRNHGLRGSRVPTPAYINQHIALVRIDGVRVNPKFVGCFLASEQPQRRFRPLTDADAKAGMNLSMVRTVQVALPPTVREQDAIAEALSDADDLIESLEQLHAKKRQIKQGAMQELLTGQRRPSKPASRRPACSSKAWRRRCSPAASGWSEAPSAWPQTRPTP